MKTPTAFLFFSLLLILSGVFCQASTMPEQKDTTMSLIQEAPSLLFLDTWTGRRAVMEESIITSLPPAPIAFMTPILVTTETVCLGQSVQLTAPSTGATQYAWSPAAGLNDSRIYNPVATTTASTVYTLSVYDANWNVTQYVYIVNVSFPIAFAGPDVSICSGDSVQLNASGGVAYVWSPAAGLSSTTVANPVASTSATTTYTVTVTNMNGCVATDEVTVFVTRTLDIKVILQGAYNATTDMMNNSLQVQDLIPTLQPYGSGPMQPGTETFSTSLSVSIVDWVLVEIRESNAATTATASTIIEKRAGLLKTDGHIVNTDGISPLVFSEITSSTAAYYIVIRHRNHLAVMSSNAIYFPAGQCLASYNFTDSASAFAYQPYFQIPEVKVDTSPNTWGMVAGDLNQDGIINATDRTEAANNAGLTGYLRFDCSMDGIVNAVDRVFTNNNTFRIAQVP